MSVKTWQLFAITEAILCLSPGPAVLLVLSVSLTRGWSPGLQASAGILVANTFYFLLSATSLGAILPDLVGGLFLIKWVGAAYLIWLGLTMIVARGAGHFDTAAHPTPARSGRGTSLYGVVTQGTTPKALVFFTAFLPQFVNPAAPLAPQIAILAATSILIEFGILASYAALAALKRT